MTHNGFYMHQHPGEIAPFADFIRRRKTKHVLEIGTLHGGTTAMWGDAASGKLISVDLPGGEFGGAAHQLFHANMLERNYKLCKQYPGRFFGVLGDSTDPVVIEEALSYLDGESLDLLFIDGNHTYEGVKADFTNYSSRVAAGGVVAFHDILDTKVHREAGCRVDLFWKELTGRFRTVEFSVGGDWGGIGAVLL